MSAADPSTLVENAQARNINKLRHLGSIHLRGESSSTQSATTRRKASGGDGTTSYGATSSLQSTGRGVELIAPRSTLARNERKKKKDVRGDGNNALKLRPEMKDLPSCLRKSSYSSASTTTQRTIRKRVSFESDLAEEKMSRRKGNNLPSMRRRPSSPSEAFHALRTRAKKQLARATSCSSPIPFSCSEGVEGKSSPSHQDDGTELVEKSRPGMKTSEGESHSLDVDGKNTLNSHRKLELQNQPEKTRCSSPTGINELNERSVFDRVSFEEDDSVKVKQCIFDEEVFEVLCQRPKTDGEDNSMFPCMFESCWA